MSTLAVIGGGPKAAALAAKAAALRLHSQHTVPDIFIYERDTLGAHWSGGNGYTDGLQPLCTLAERDLGFPYHLAYGKAVAEDLFAEYSWQAFAVREGLGPAGYEQWVLNGRHPPAHSDFAAYLESSIRRSGAEVRYGEVHGLDHDARTGRWQVTWTGKSGTLGIDRHDAVVITGSGPALPPLPGALTPTKTRNLRVFDGTSFWTHLVDIEQILSAEPADDRRVVLIGAGGTAAAIAYWFVRNRADVPITIIGREPTLYARHPGYFEDRLFSDESAWAALPAHARDEFVRRLTTGVVWDYVLQGLGDARIAYQCADAIGFRTLPPPSTGLHPEVQVDVRDTVPPGAPASTNVTAQEGAVFVDARGFDRWWFTSLLPPALAAQLSGPQQAGILASMDDALRISAGGFPAGLHVPMLASRQGPAAGNLMALGWVSDRILRAFVPPPTPGAGGAIKPAP
ncbi:SidA/IucD/PvdA family monooxygenase [Roseateles sp.]|uniref:SidA/IucD/PvdA family monooxygenase n=1 Tax=Roseateles sp. TaxID=1971397 RepID=UPI0025DDC4A2|nr:SidA/IucD/PvdA family monooxygenase [Roseateles sp.]MBV8034135.1 SidA/IucD/PvdA family monooxygenase [Roseateles sp.]